MERMFVEFNHLIFKIKHFRYDSITSIHQSTIHQTTMLQQKFKTYTPNHKTKKNKTQSELKLQSVIIQYVLWTISSWEKFSSLFLILKLSVRKQKHTHSLQCSEYLVRFLYIVISIGGFDEHKI